MAEDNLPPEDDDPGAPEWMVTFSDCMTLLLTFFVLMLSFSSISENKYRDLAESFGQAYTQVRHSESVRKDSMQSSNEIYKTDATKRGSLTPNNTTEKKSNFASLKMPLNYRNLKILSDKSSEFFLGNGQVLSHKGRNTLDCFATIAINSPTRIVVSEFGPEEDIDLSLKRATKMVDFLVRKGVRKDLINISASCLSGNEHEQRQVEITLLEESIYKQ